MTALRSLGQYLGLQSATPEPASGYGTVNQPTPSSRQTTKTKIEPKVYLAAERTLLSWLRLAVLIGSFAVALVNSAKHGTGNPLVGKIFGVVYAVIGASTVIYAWRVFETRRQRITARYPGHFDELYGPPLLCFVLFTAVLVNFIFQVSNRGHVKSPKDPFIQYYLSRFIETR